METTGSLEDTEFLCERALKTKDTFLHSCYRNSVFAMDRLLMNYKSVFPFYTNHTFEHSTQVINYCNMLAGAENVEKLNADELYILLMGAGLHDIGMGVSRKDFDAVKDRVDGLDQYIKDHPDEPLGEYTREFHQELSAETIRKYSALFEIPSEEYVYCIGQIARGHRKHDLMNIEEYDPAFRLESGNTVRLPYLAVLVKLADELDVTADRNLLFDMAVLQNWNNDSKAHFIRHSAVHRLLPCGDKIVIQYDTDDAEIEKDIRELERKARLILEEYVTVIRERTDLTPMFTGLNYVKEKKE